MTGMMTIGIVGGIGPESTIDYYRRIIASYRHQRKDGSYPSNRHQQHRYAENAGFRGAESVGHVKHILLQALSG